MKILIISGFLGAGKTTFIKELSRQTGKDFCIFENEYAQVDIDKALLSADEVHCELPFCCSDGGTELWHGVMDAVYLKDGQWHIIDYKTSADPADLDGRYEAQLTSYVRAFREMTGEEADARIYHLEI